MSEKSGRLHFLLRVLSRELLVSLLLLFGVSTVVFLILRLAPGDPLSALFSSATMLGEQREELLRAMDVPTSWYGQYFSWLADIVHGDFGHSLVSGTPVSTQLLNSGFLTLVLCVGSILLTLCISIPIAIYSVVRTSRGAQGLVLSAYTISALPLFWLGYVVIWIFARQLGIFPVYDSGAAAAASWAALVLPVFLLAIGNGLIGEMVRHLREALARTLAEDYIRTARAKGAPVWWHAFREGVLLPVSELTTGRLPHVLSGAVIVEQIFNLPGLGRLAWQATEDRDFPLVMGAVIAAAVLVRCAGIGHRLISAWVNPRAAET